MHDVVSIQNIFISTNFTIRIHIYEWPIRNTCLCMFLKKINLITVYAMDILF